MAIGTAMIGRMRKLAGRQAARVAAVTAVGMVVGLAADVLLAVRLGVGGVTDALFAALLLPRLIGNVGRESAKFSLLSTVIEVERREGPAAAAELTSRLLNLFLLAGLGLATAAWLAAPGVARVVAPGLEAADQARAAMYLRLCVPMAVFALGSSVLEVWLNSRRAFVVTAARNVWPPLVVVAVILATWRLPSAPGWIAASYAAGFGLFFAVLVVVAQRRGGWRWRVTAMPDRPTLRRVRGALSYPLAGFTLRQSGRVAERAIASLAGPGGLSAYTFAYRLLGALQNLVGLSVAITGQPKLTEHDLSGDRTAFDRALWRRARAVLAVAVPMGLAVAVLHRPIIAVLFGYGRFDAAAIERTATVLLWFAPAIVGYCLVPVLSAALYAQRRFGAVLYNMALATAVNVTLAWWWQQVFGLRGVAMATSAAAIVAVCNLVWLLRRRRALPAATPTSTAAATAPPAEPIEP